MVEFTSILTDIPVFYEVILRLRKKREIHKQYLKYITDILTDKFKKY